MIQTNQEQVEPRWLLLIHQIPPKPDYFRVKVRRRLQNIGAVPLKNSVYLLPQGDEAMEDFQWLRRSIVGEGGEATLCAASFIEGVTDGELEALFRAQSDQEYRDIIEAAGDAEAGESHRARLEKRLAEVRARDFFDAPGRGPAEQAVAALREFGRKASGGETGPDGATWVTRSGVFVDRMASAWLIARFIDPTARFRFVPASAYDPAPGELRFDMYHGEYTHAGDSCTFETLMSEFGLRDPALSAIAEIVHDLDLKDDRYQREETAGVASMIRGIVARHQDDEDRLQAGRDLFDGLYAAFQRGV